MAKDSTKTQPSNDDSITSIQNLTPSHFGSSGSTTFFISTPRGGPLPEPTIKRKLRLIGLQSFSAIIANYALVLIVSYALIKRFLSYTLQLLRSSLDLVSSLFSLDHHPPLQKNSKNQNLSRDWDDPDRFKNERITKDFHYYAQQAGFEIIEQSVETLDGYYLQVWKISKPGQDRFTLKDGKGGYPILIQHGLFQSSGSFITSEERSLAFWLAEHGGYQVYLGNNRGIFKMGHRKLKRSDPRFWDYNMKELAIYDLPALVDHVIKDTGHSNIGFIGHSQGNATMFCSLSRGMVPKLGEKLSSFIALAPAVYAGPLTCGFPFGILKSMRWRTWRKVFGILDFLPVMSLCVDWLPSTIFGFLGYQMFAFLFNWTDRNWLLRRKLKMFRFTPSPVSSAGIFWWTGYQGFSTRGCVLDPKVENWWDERFPPLSLYHGESDYLVLADPLIERLEKHEKTVTLLRNFRLEDGEHCDTFWHADAVEICFHLILEDIEKGRKIFKHKESLKDSNRAPSKVDDGGLIQKILCEPSSIDEKMREQIMRGILTGKSVDLHSLLGSSTNPLASSGPSSLDPEPGRAPCEALRPDSPYERTALLEQDEQVDGDFFEDDRDRDQAPMMSLERDV